MANINIHGLEQVDSELNSFELRELTGIEIALINGGGGVGSGGCTWWDDTLCPKKIARGRAVPGICLPDGPSRIILV